MDQQRERSRTGQRIAQKERDVGDPDAEDYQLARSHPILYIAVACSLAAALIHALVIREHFAEWWGYGTFFVVVALAQALYAIALVRWPRQELFILGIVGNLAIIVLYIVTRTAGIPLFGPHAGEVEEIGGIDVLSKILELALVIALAVLLRAGRRSHMVERV